MNILVVMVKTRSIWNTFSFRWQLWSWFSSSSWFASLRDPDLTKIDLNFLTIPVILINLHSAALYIFFIIALPILLSKNSKYFRKLDEGEKVITSQKTKNTKTNVKYLFLLHLLSQSYTEKKIETKIEKWNSINIWKE